MQTLKELDLQLGELVNRQFSLSSDYLFHQVSKWVHDVSSAIIVAENSGLTKEVISSKLSSSRGIHKKSRWIHRLQTWPNGYQGDFETIEQLMAGVPASNSRRVSNILEEIALNCSAAQQHRNKVSIQAQKIRRCALSNRDILSLACGGSVDAFLALDALKHSSSQLVVNDIDEYALKLSETRLQVLGDRLRLVPGNIIEVVRSKELGRFDLILAGGLFDYLQEKAALFVLKSALKRLKSGGEFFFTNISIGNPFRPWIEYLANWNLIERSESEVRELLSCAGVKEERVTIERDRTGLTILTTVRAQ